MDVQLPALKVAKVSKEVRRATNQRNIPYLVGQKTQDDAVPSQATLHERALQVTNDSGFDMAIL